MPIGSASTQQKILSPMLDVHDFFLNARGEAYSIGSELYVPWPNVDIKQ